MTKFYYKVLGLPENSSHDDIKKKYRKLALEWHPDKNPENRTRANEMFTIISEAYQVLGNREKRAEYDKTLTSSSYKPSKLYNPMDLFNYIFGIKKPKEETTQSTTSNQTSLYSPTHFNDNFSNHMNMLSIMPSIFNQSNMMTGFNDNFFKQHTNSPGVFHQSTSIIRNGKKETKSVNGYYKDGKKHIEKRHVYIDKDGKQKTDVKKYIVPSKTTNKLRR